MNGKTLNFDVLGLYRDVFTMLDRETGTVWEHLTGRAVQGQHNGKRLKIVPMPQLTWGEWKAAFPHTKVLDRNTPFQGYYRNVQIGEADPSEALYGDKRLPPNALVVGVEVNDDFVGFLGSALASRGGAVNAEVGGEPIVVVYDITSRVGIAFKRTVDGQTLTFSASRDSTGKLQLTDEQTGSRWNLAGKATAGSLAGQALTFVPSFISEWYGWSAYHPQTGVYAG